MKLRRTLWPLLLLGLIPAVAVTALGRRSVAAAPDAHATEANITRVTTRILEQSQFAHHPFDGELASTLLDRYVDSLDGTRSLFLQSDVDELATLRPTLAKATRADGDTTAAHAIFARYLVRLEQRDAYVTESLKTKTFDFTGHDTYSLDREHAKRPADLTAARALWAQQLRADYLQEKLADKTPQQIVAALSHRYAQSLSTMKALRSEEVLEGYLDTLAHVYDPHSDYLGHEQMETRAISMKLSLVGIGATLDGADGCCKVRAVVAGGPAERSGLLKAGDRIVSVAQDGKDYVDVTTMPISHAVDLIRGSKGSTVTLKILPAGAAEGTVPRTAAIVRDDVKLEDQQAKARIVDLPMVKGTPIRIGVIDLPSFYASWGDRDGAERRSATEDVSRLLAKLKVEHVRGVVLDLRRNGGGALDEAISLTGLFIRTGPVVQTRDQAGDIEVGADNDPAVRYDGPLIVLTSRFSASASEIVAGALQDYGRAVVVGDSSTFGKGTVQSILPLDRVLDRAGLAHAYDPGALAVTISKFYRPSGASTQLRGVAADVVVPSTSDLNEVSESALKNPLPWDVVPAAAYERLDRVQPYVADLRARSQRRIAGDKEFTDVAGDLTRLKERFATKSLSLNEAERRLELGQLKQRREERATVERSRRAAAPTTYEITLANASSPGLPPAVASTGHAATAPSHGSPEADDVGDLSSRRSSTDDIVLTEGERVLSDYVELLSLGK
jgi:carboxyl-terminal processing protease